MKLSIRFAILLFFVFPSFAVFAQQKQIDSTLSLLRLDKEDSVKVNHLSAISQYYNNFGNSNKALDFGQKSLSLAQKLNDKKGMAMSFKQIGSVEYAKGDYKNALIMFRKSLSLYNNLAGENSRGNLLNNIGLCYWNTGDYPPALDYFFNAIEAYKKNNNKGVAMVTGNIGLVYWNQDDYKDAINYCNKSLNQYNTLKDTAGIARATGNLGLIYWSENNYKMALTYDLEALSMYEKLRDKNGIAVNTGNIGNIYGSLDSCEKAIKYDSLSLQLYLQLGNKSGIARNIGNIGNLYLAEKKYEIAETYLLKGLNLADSIRQLYLVKFDNKQLSILYAETGRWKKAYETYKEYDITKDSLVNDDKSKQIGRIEAKTEYDKKILIQKQKEILSDAENKRQKNIIIFMAIIALTVLVIAFIIFRSLKITRKQKSVIELQKAEAEQQKNKVEEQKYLIEIKNKEVLDSIAYAKRLQDAILPPIHVIKKHFPKSFVFYKPKDIVAGDFYWMETIGDNVFVAACDCTGHGVPGAMVSLVCSNALNRSVKEFGMKEPGKILDKVNELVLETFEKSESEVNDGMDISLCSFNLKTNELEWSGANNPFWYFTEGKLNKITADKQAIGQHNFSKSFNTHKLQIQKGTAFYLFTDGYADQFGGQNGKKFKYKQLQQILFEMQSFSMDKQGEMLKNIFEEWKGNLEQVDDILIMGISI
ncbi:MAG TPA: tetratricopeptide repeat protein [Bacteroidia bacterium]|nr:tetratricopeptide repeat protein [Bacteroidia bacterium]